MKTSVADYLSIGAERFISRFFKTESLIFHHLAVPFVLPLSEALVPRIASTSSHPSADPIFAPSFSSGPSVFPWTHTSEDEPSHQVNIQSFLLFNSCLYLTSSHPNFNFQSNFQLPLFSPHRAFLTMRPTTLLPAILAPILAPFAIAAPGKPDKGYRHVKNLDAFLHNTEVRFAEYDALGWYVPSVLIC